VTGPTDILAAKVLEILGGKGVSEILEKLVESAIDTIKRETRNMIDEKFAKQESILFDFGQKLDKCHVSLEKIAKQTEEALSNMKQSIQKLERTCEDVYSRFDRTDTITEELEMYTRRNSIRIFGLEEDVATKDNNGIFVYEDSVKKAISFFKDKLEVDINVSQIDRVHRIGKQTRDPRFMRQLIVKFVSHLDKERVIRNRKKLKGTKISVSEDLTNGRAQFLKFLHKHNSVTASWSNDGRIMAIINGEKHLLTGYDQFEHIVAINRKGS